MALLSSLWIRSTRCGWTVSTIGAAAVIAWSDLRAPIRYTPAAIRTAAIGTEIKTLFLIVTGISLYSCVRVQWVVGIKRRRSSVRPFPDQGKDRGKD